MQDERLGFLAMFLAGAHVSSVRPLVPCWLWRTTLVGFRPSCTFVSCLQWLETRPNRQVCPVCKAGISRDKVIPLYGRGSTGQQDPRWVHGAPLTAPRGHRLTSIQHPSPPPFSGCLETLSFQMLGIQMGVSQEGSRARLPLAGL